MKYWVLGKKRENKEILKSEFEIVFSFSVHTLETPNWEWKHKKNERERNSHVDDFNLIVCKKQKILTEISKEIKKKEIEAEFQWIYAQV